jgi:hypothetical protein
MVDASRRSRFTVAGSLPWSIPLRRSFARSRAAAHGELSDGVTALGAVHAVVDKERLGAFGVDSDAKARRLRIVIPIGHGALFGQLNLEYEVVIKPLRPLGFLGLFASAPFPIV